MSPVLLLPFAAAALWEGERLRGVIWCFFRSRRNSVTQAKRAAFTAASPPVRISGIRRIASNPATPYSSLGFSIFTFRKASFFHQTCCPTSRQAVSPRCPPEVVTCSHTRAPRAPAPPRLWLLPGTRRPPAVATCVPSASPPLSPRSPRGGCARKACLQQTPSPGAKGAWVRAVGCATGGSENRIDCQKGDLGKEAKSRRVSPKGRRRRYVINAA